jgi:prophage regulatory protein
MTHNIGQRDAAYFSAPQKRLIPLADVVRKVGVCRSVIYRLALCGEFPRPVKIGRASRWLESEVDAWIVAVADARGPVNYGKAA